MSFSAKDVKDLRVATGLGMMDCKKALVETGGDMQAAKEYLREKQGAKVQKKAGRIAADGLVTIRIADDHKSAVIVEVNSETDFVARDSHFTAFAEDVAKVALNNPGLSVDELSNTASLANPAHTLEEARASIVAKLGENITIRRVQTLQGQYFGGYVHGVKIGVLVELESENAQVASDVAMQVAAMNPAGLSEKQVDSALVAKEREIFTEQAKESGKPDALVEKMVERRMKKFFSEITLLGQAFVKNPDQTVADYLKQHNAEVLNFIRFELAEGIEKDEVNFADEVKAQVESLK